MTERLPKRHKGWWRYLPLVSVVSLFWWISGVGIWIHHTGVAINYCQSYVEILQLTAADGVVTLARSLQSSMIGTSIVFAIFAVCIHALGLWRGTIEADQDTTGDVDDEACMYVTWLNVVIQIAWWIIVIWLIVLLSGFGVFTATIYIAQQGLQSILVYQATVPIRGGYLPMIDGYCPWGCLSTLSCGLFVWDPVADIKMSFCICDIPTLTAAFNAISSAENAVPGMIVGMLFMIIYGIVLLAHMVGMLVRTNVENGMSERLTDQGWTEGSAPKPSGPPKRR